MTPLQQQILTFFNNSPSKPYVVNEIAAGIKQPVTDVTTSLNELHKEGYVYSTTGNNGIFWYPTTYAFPKNIKTTRGWSPAIEYQKRTDALKSLKMKVENRADFLEEIQGELEPYLDTFVKNHPEYSKLIAWLNRNPPHKKEFWKDIAAILLRMDMSHRDIAFAGEKYKVPDNLIAVEHAFLESLKRLTLHTADRRKDTLTQDEYYESYKKTAELAKKVQKDFIDRIITSSPKGTVIPTSEIEKFVKTDLEKIVANKNHIDLFNDMVASKLSADSIDPKKFKIFFTNTNPDIIIDILTEELKNNTITINNFGKTANEATAVTVYSQIFNNNNFDNYDLSQISFLIPFTMRNCSFKNTNFSLSRWESVKITNCDFSKAQITDAIFKPSVFTDNKIAGTDFKDSSLNKKIDWEKNTGIPKNIYIKDIDYDSQSLKRIKHDTLPISSHSIPLTDEEINDAKTIALAIKKLLSDKDIFAHLDLSLFKVAKLNTEVIQQLRDWLDDSKQTPPTFLADDELKNWLVDNSKNGELAKAGFDGKDISILFKRSRELSEGPQISKDEKLKRMRDAKINAFVAQFQDQENIPIKGLLNLLNNKEGHLYSLFNSFNKDSLTLTDLQRLYSNLVSSIKESHYNNYVTPKKRYQAFSYTTYVHSLKEEGEETGEGGGDWGWDSKFGNKMFAVALRPDISKLPSSLAKDVHRSVTYGSSHIAGAIAYSRVMPLRYTLTSAKGKPTVRNIWFIVEMQSDAYQHAFGSEWSLYKGAYKGKEPKGDKGELLKQISQREEKKDVFKNNLAAFEAASNFRKYFSNWPENLLNAIIELAGNNNVDEIWMPQGSDIESNVAAHGNWSYNYDRPAKAFNGQLKDVGVNVKLDPGFYANGKSTSNVYVIPVTQKVTSSLRFEKVSSLTLDWTEGQPETSQEKKQRLLAIIKHPEYYNYSSHNSTWQMSEYEKALEELKDEFGINIHEPDMLSKEDALLAHTPEYADKIFKKPSRNYNPGWADGPWNESSQKAVLRSAGGTIRANNEALSNGIAVQMYDAFHHAYPDHGEGFCVLNDVAIAAKKLSKEGKKVMIIDTDVHQGQGTAVCTQGDPNIYTVSYHQENIYPRKEKSSLDIGYEDYITGEKFLTLLVQGLNQAMSEFGKPDLVMYVAGTDLYKDDSLSDTKIEIEDIRMRDEIVFKFFGEKGIPVSVSVPQGYARRKEDSRAMIKNTLREANKALSYYDKKDNLTLSWADTFSVGDRVKSLHNLFTKNVEIVAGEEGVVVYVPEDENLEIFPVVVKFDNTNITTNMFPYELQKISENDLRLDWVADEKDWSAFIRIYIKTFVDHQMRANPDLGNKKSLAKDAYEFMLGEIPENIKNDPEFGVTLNKVKEELFEEYGDFTAPPEATDNLNLDTFTDNSPGGELLDHNGQPMGSDEGNWYEDLNLNNVHEDESDVKDEMINEYLDQLSQAQRDGDQAKVDSIKQKIQELQSLSSLKLDWALDADSSTLKLSKTLRVPKGWEVRRFVSKLNELIAIYPKSKLRTKNIDGVRVTPQEQLEELRKIVEPQIQDSGLQYNFKQGDSRSVYTDSLRFYFPIERPKLRTPWKNIIKTLEDRGYSPYMDWGHSNIGGYSLLLDTPPNHRKTKEICQIIEEMAGLPISTKSGASERGGTRIYVKLPKLSSLNLDVFNKLGELNGKDIQNTEKTQITEGTAPQNNENASQEALQSPQETQLDIYYLDVEEIVDIHNEIVRALGGAPGLFQGGEEKLEAAIGRMQSSFGEKEFYPTLFEKAAVLMHSLITSHPFVDGNKRTAYSAAIHFLHYNGFNVDDSEELADIIIQVASDEAGYSHLHEWIMKNAKHWIDKHDDALRKLTSLNLDWADISEIDDKPSPQEILKRLNFSLVQDIENQPGVMSDQRYIDVYPVTKQQLIAANLSHIFVLSDSPYDWYYIGEREFMGDSLFDLTGVNTDGTTDIIEASFINSLDDIPDMHKYLSTLQWQLPTEDNLTSFEYLKQLILTAEAGKTYYLDNFPYKYFSIDKEKEYYDDPNSPVEYSWTLGKNYDILGSSGPYFPTHGNMVKMWKKELTTKLNLISYIAWLFDENTGKLNSRWLTKANGKLPSLKLDWAKIPTEKIQEMTANFAIEAKKLVDNWGDADSVKERAWLAKCNKAVDNAILKSNMGTLKKKGKPSYEWDSSNLSHANALYSVDIKGTRTEFLNFMKNIKSPYYYAPQDEEQLNDQLSDN